MENGDQGKLSRKKSWDFVCKPTVYKPNVYSSNVYTFALKKKHLYRRGLFFCFLFFENVNSGSCLTAEPIYKNSAN